MKKKSNFEFELIKMLLKAVFFITIFVFLVIAGNAEHPQTSFDVRVGTSIVQTLMMVSVFELTKEAFVSPFKVLLKSFKVASKMERNSDIA